MRFRKFRDRLAFCRFPPKFGQLSDCAVVLHRSAARIGSAEGPSPRIGRIVHRDPPFSEKMDRALLDALAAGFPSLTFDAQLRLVAINDVARKLFAFPSDIALDQFNANWFFAASLDGSAGAQDDLEKSWSRIIQEGTQNWENGLSQIEYWTQEDGVRRKCICEGIITSPDVKPNGIISNGNTQQYSIAFIRPSPPSQSIPHPPPLHHSTTIAKIMPPIVKTTFASIFESMSVLREQGNEGLSREKLQETFDHLPQIAFTADAQGHIKSFNKRWYEFTGLGLAESLDPKIWLALFHPDDIKGAVSAWMVSLVTGETYNVSRSFARVLIGGADIA